MTSSLPGYLQLNKLARSAPAEGVRLALAGDCATQHIANALRGYGVHSGLPVQVFDADYDQVRAQLTDPGSELYGFSPEYVLLVFSVECLWEEFCREDEREHFAERRLAQPGDALPALTDGYLRKMLELCHARGIPVLLLYLPSNLNETDYRKVFTAAQYAEEYGVRFLNLLDHADALGLDYQHDFRDRFHLNSFGAGKATAFLGEYLETHYSIDRDRPAEITNKWNRDLADYYAWIETQ